METIVIKSADIVWTRDRGLDVGEIPVSKVGFTGMAPKTLWVKFGFLKTPFDRTSCDETDEGEITWTYQSGNTLLHVMWG
jgi:hypothetical protein